MNMNARATRPHLNKHISMCVYALECPYLDTFSHVRLWVLARTTHIFGGYTPSALALFSLNKSLHSYQLHAFYWACSTSQMQDNTHCLCNAFSFSFISYILWLLFFFYGDLSTHRILSLLQATLPLINLSCMTFPPTIRYFSFSLASCNIIFFFLLLLCYSFSLIIKYFRLICTIFYSLALRNISFIL